MKKFLWIVLMFCITAYGIFAENSGKSSTNNLSADNTSADLPSGVIQKITGKVQLKSAGSSDFVNAKAGDEIMQSTIVSTGLKSTAIIMVGSSVINVAPLTRLSLAEMQSSLNAADGKQASPPAGKLSCCP